MTRQRGFSIVTAIFILVVLAALGAAMVTFSSAQHQSLALDMQGSRGYQAARAGIEWGAYQIRKGPVGGFACPSTTTLSFAGTPLNGFATSVVCASSTHDEVGQAPLTRYLITATATYGTPGSVDYISRQVSAVIVK